MSGTYRLEMSLAAVRSWLAGHPMHTIANFNPKQKCFRVTMRRSHETSDTTTVAFTGITHFMQRYFGKKVSAARPRGMPRTAYHGVEAGTKFHARCDKFIKLCQESPDDARAFEQEKRASCKLFNNLANYVQTKGYVPVASEYTVCDPVLGFATSIDCIWADVAKQRLMFVELKTGYDGVFVKTHGMVREPLHFFNGVSPKNRALAQVYLSCIQHIISGAPAGWTLEAHVWHITAAHIQPYCLDSRCMARDFANGLHQKLVECNRLYSATPEHRHPLQKGHYGKKN